MTLPAAKSIAICVSAVVVTLGVGAMLFVWSGAYNVAASEQHFAVTHWLLDFVKRRSVETQSLLISAPPLDDPDLARLGGAHYHGGCAPCHGGPGDPSNPVVQQMYPEPADLPLAAPSWTPGQLFWIAKNGLKFTGMPAWVAQNRDDEVWAVVAFLRASAKNERRRIPPPRHRRSRSAAERDARIGGAWKSGGNSIQMPPLSRNRIVAVGKSSCSEPRRPVAGLSRDVASQLCKWLAVERNHAADRRRAR